MKGGKTASSRGNDLHIYQLLEPRQFINQSGDQTISICIHLKSKCGVVQHIRVLCHSANKTLTWTWPGFCLSTYTHREKVSWEQPGACSLKGFPWFGNTRSSNWNRSVFFGIYYRNRTSQLSWLFFPVKDEKGSLHACGVRVKVTQTMCEYVRALYLFPLVERWRSRSAWLLCMSSFSLWPQSHKTPLFHWPQAWRMIDGWLLGGQECGGRPVKLLEKMPPIIFFFLSSFCHSLFCQLAQCHSLFCLDALVPMKK